MRFLPLRMALNRLWLIIRKKQSDAPSNSSQSTT
jgi:hypothetical protein